MGSFLLFRMPDVHRASRIAHHASCTLKDASLAFQRDAELRRLALVGTLQQRQGALAGTRVDLTARFYAAVGYFPVGAFIIIIIGVIIGDFARIHGHCY